MAKNNKQSSGFTLIELLVVISIIALLTSMILTGINVMKAREQDTERLANLNSLNSALELFYASNSRYPSSVDGDCNFHNSFLAGGCLQALTLGGYISKLPPDGSTYKYDNWCRDPAVYDDQHFRMYTWGTFNHNGVALGWWGDIGMGKTNCIDPS